MERTVLPPPQTIAEIKPLQNKVEKTEILLYTHYPIQTLKIPVFSLQEWDDCCSLYHVRYCVLRGFVGVTKGRRSMSVGYMKEQRTQVLHALEVLSRYGMEGTIDDADIR